MRTLTSSYNQVFRNQTLVFSRGPVSGEYSSRWEVVRVPCREDLAEEHYDALFAEEGPLIVGLLDREFGRDGTLWLSLIDGAVAGYAWTRHPGVGQDWFVDVSQEDIIVLATVTFASFRGNGVMSDLVQSALQRELSVEGQAFINCKAWNLSAIKFIERSGFTRVR